MRDKKGKAYALKSQWSTTIDGVECRWYVGIVYQGSDGPSAFIHKDGLISWNAMPGGWFSDREAAAEVAERYNAYEKPIEERS
jgi:hypothetical protein